MLGNPTHIQLLVNPNERTIVVRACSDDSLLAHRVTCQKDVDCEFYSKDLLRQFQVVNHHLEENASYLINGIFYSSHQLALFKLDDMQQINAAVM